MLVKSFMALIKFPQLLHITIRIRSFPAILCCMVSSVFLHFGQQYSAICLPLYLNIGDLLRDFYCFLSGSFGGGGGGVGFGRFLPELGSFAGAAVREGFSR